MTSNLNDLNNLNNLINNVNTVLLSSPAVVEQQTSQDLKQKYSDIYLLRNERFFKLYRFSDGKAIEPDFILFMTEKNSGEEVIYQLFIEPKGNLLLSTDVWKEEFLESIEKEAIVDQGYKLIGMPFYNQENKKDEFEKKFKNI